ncbi:MAG: hypothetical protein ACI83D_000273 [Planctomycetota bacterium]
MRNSAYSREIVSRSIFMKKESPAYLIILNTFLIIVVSAVSIFAVWSAFNMMVVIAEGKAQEQRIVYIIDATNKLEQEFSAQLQPLTKEFAFSNGYGEPVSVYFLETETDSVALLEGGR